MDKSHNNKLDIVAIYARVSKNKIGGISLESQESICRAWAEKRSAKTILVFKDKGRTGRNLDRPGMQDLLKFMKSNKGITVVAWRIDRLSRNTEDFYSTIYKTAKNNNCKIAVVDENEDDIFKMKSSALACSIGHAEDEVKSDSERTKDAMDERAKEGYVQGKAPFGYKNIRDENNHGIIIVDKQKAHIVKRVFELYATGIYSYKQVGIEVAKQGFTKKNGKPQPPRTFERMLHNPVYTGKVVRNGIEYDGKHEPIISKELFNRVQHQFKEKRKQKGKNENFVYTNFITCKKCGYAMISYLKHGAHNSGDYIYYHCSNYSGAHKKQKNFRQEIFDDAMLKILISFSITDKEILFIKKDLYKSISELKDYENKSLKDLTNQREKLIDTIYNAEMEHLNGNSALSSDLYFEITKRRNMEIKELDNKITEIKRSSNLKNAQMQNDILVDFARKLPELYLKGTPQQKRLIVVTISEKIEFDEDKERLYIKLKPIYDRLRVRKDIENSVKEPDRTLKLVANNEIDTTAKNQEKITQIEQYRTPQKQVYKTIEPLFEAPFDIIGGKGN